MTNVNGLSRQFFPLIIKINYSHMSGGPLQELEVGVRRPPYILVGLYLNKDRTQLQECNIIICTPTIFKDIHSKLS